MKVVFTGAEYYLSEYLNCLKVPFVMLIIVLFALSLCARIDYNTEWKATIIGKHFKAYVALCIFTSAYLFLVWR